MVVASIVNDFQTISSIIFIKIDLIENCYLSIDFDIMYLQIWFYPIHINIFLVLEIKNKKNIISLLSVLVSKVF